MAPRAALRESRDLRGCIRDLKLVRRTHISPHFFFSEDSSEATLPVPEEVGEKSSMPYGYYQHHFSLSTRVDGRGMAFTFERKISYFFLACTCTYAVQAGGETRVYTAV